VDALWRYGPELVTPDALDAEMVALGLGADLDALRPRWEASVRAVLDDATLLVPAAGFPARGGRHGRHTEHLGRMLAEMQIVARSHPGASW
jgi:ring-1,2-phenylacetyl-CoA epoxidase subunit PaaC